MNNQRRKWYPPTPEQVWRKIEQEYDQAILSAYAKAGDEAAKKELEKREQQ